MSDDNVSHDRSNNRAFDGMKADALRWLAGRDSVEIAQSAGVILEGDDLVVQSLGLTFTVDGTTFAILDDIDEWHALVLWHYLACADGTPNVGRWMDFGAMQGGAIRGSGFANTSGTTLGKALGSLPPKAVWKRCESLGGQRIDSKADCTVVFPLFPRFPILMNLWFSDEEFDGTARLLVDESADHYLSVEDAVTAGELIVQKLLTGIQEG